MYLYKADFSLAALHNVVLGHSLLLVGLQQHESGKTEAAQILAYTNEYDELIGAVDMWWFVVKMQQYAQRTTTAWTNENTNDRRLPFNFFFFVLLPGGDS